MRDLFLSWRAWRQSESLASQILILILCAATEASEADLSWLRGRSAPVWEAAQAWAVNEIARLQDKYPHHWAAAGAAA